MMSLSTLLLFTSPVEFGSMAHIAPLVVAFIFGAFIIYYAKHKLNEKNKVRVYNVLGFTVSLTVVAYHLHLMFITDYDVSRDLPLFLCSFMALWIPILTYYRKFWMYEILVFWILAGTSQGIITPDLAESFPSFEYIRYWVVHLGLVIIILYATIVFKNRPRFKSIFRSILALQVYFVFLLIVNRLLGANYSYLMKKPEVASVLDYLGEWPMYIIVVELMLIPYFIIIYIPFYFINKKEIAT